MRFIDIHSHSISSVNFTIISIDPRNIDLDEMNTPFSIGLHPWWIDQLDLASFYSHLPGYLSHPNCMALGEVGLDRSRGDFDKQLEVFEGQLRVAGLTNIETVVLHCVRSFNEIISLIKKTNYSGNLVFHDFNGNREIVESLLKLPCFFSYGSKLFEPNSKGFKVFKEIPIDRLLFETDDSEERRIEEVYAKASCLLSLELNELCDKISDNFGKCFGKKAYIENS
ncbi:MAG: hypothetical protein HOE90_22925 [Bacteriovoracaceae bacterium]|jgi:TatD DNase family protein|nr:hypothetical protein [Bacteriovoracaceae bacterium]